MGKQKKDSKGRNLLTGESQRADGSYMYRYTDAWGERKAVYSWRLVATDKIPAGKRDNLPLREQEKNIQRDLNDGLRTQEGSSITLNEMFERYINSKSKLKETTKLNYISAYNRDIKGRIGKKKISTIRYSDIVRLYNQIIEDREIKPGSIMIYHTILHPLFTMAVRDGYVRSNPTDGAIGEIKNNHSWGREKRRALTIEEQEALIEFVKGSNTYRRWLNLLTFFLGTGCRVGEVVGIRWKDIDFENRTISINHSVAYRAYDASGCKFHISTPKTPTSIRTIPMLNEVRTALLQEKKAQMQKGISKLEIDGYSGFVFLNRNGNLHIPSNVNSVFYDITGAYNRQEEQKAKQEKRKPRYIGHFSAHSLRHTFCTRFCENETNIKVIQEIMGHSDIGVTMNVYAEATENKKKEVFKNLEGKIKIS